MVVRLAESLALPLRERNELLLAAGYAPAYPERSLDEPELAPVRTAIDSATCPNWGTNSANTYPSWRHPSITWGSLSRCACAPRTANCG